MQHHSKHPAYTCSRGTLLATLVALALLLSGQVVQAQSGLTCPAGSHCIYLPVVSSLRPPAGDLIVEGIEVTQAVQDSANSVPLVAGRGTALRIFARLAGGSQPLSAVKVRVTAFRAGTALAGSPVSVTAAVPVTVNRASLSSSINLNLPSAWLSGTVDLQIQLDPENWVAETDETNNSYRKPLAFTQVAPLQVKIVPIRYTHAPNGHTYPAPARDSISDWVFRTYPVSRVDVSWRTPYAFTGDLTKTEEWQRLLSELNKIKLAEGAPAAQVYYGLVPPSDSASTWFYGGVAGIGYVNLRTSVGMNITSSAGQIAAHEIGHNLGMYHTPCGSPAGIDTSFPYSDGSIGQFGLDLTTWQLYTPSTKDVMSYCTPRWISDYTYRTLYRSQSQVSPAVLALAAEADEGTIEPSAQRALLFRARLDAVNATRAELLPAYILPESRVAQAEPGAYQLQLLDAQGAVITQLALQAYAIGDGEGAEIQALVPLPELPVHRLRLLKDGQLLAQKNMAVPEKQAHPQASAAAAGPGALRLGWDEPGPALVRYSTDSGRNWTILAVDARGGELLVDPADLPAPGGIFEALPADTWR